eukprot:1364878-Amorphochlora_amoeboformis.AAC.1
MSPCFNTSIPTLTANPIQPWLNSSPNMTLTILIPIPSSSPPPIPPKPNPNFEFTSGWTPAFRRRHIPGKVIMKI